MHWLVTYRFAGDNHALTMRSQNIPSLKAIAFKSVMTAYNEAPPVPLNGMHLELWMRECGIELIDVTLQRRNRPHRAVGTP